MAIIAKVLVIVAFACMVSAMPLEGQEQEARADLLAVNEVPQQEGNAISDSTVRQKRHGFGFGYGGLYPAYGGIGYGYPAYGGYYGGAYGGGYGYPAYGGYGSYGYGSYGYGGGFW